VNARAPYGVEELEGRAGDRSPADDSLELAFEVRSRAIRTWLTVRRAAGETETETLRGRGVELPYHDGSFARVACRRGLQLLPDRSRALEEMRRVLIRHGEIEVAVRGSIERSPLFAELAHSLERHAGVRSAVAVRWLFCMPEPDDLRGVLAAAAFDEIRVDVVRTTDRSPSIRAFLAPSGSEARIVPEWVRSRVLADLERASASWMDRDGLLITTETIVGRARRP
jgi:SAM-dependent methyltransferase